MGGEFVALADDPSGVYWNPAALVTGPFVGAAFEGQVNERRGRLSGADRRRTLLVTLAIPAAAVSYWRVHTDEVTPTGDATQAGRDDPAVAGSALQSLVTHTIGLTVVQPVTEGVSVGATLRYVRGEAGAGVTREGPAGQRLVVRGGVRSAAGGCPGVGHRQRV
jgi:hypothetical protein